MKRRKFLQIVPVVLSSIPLAGGSQARVAPTAFSLVLKNGRAFYEGKWQALMIGIGSEGKMEILQATPENTKVIDLGGKVVSPGFIDILADNAFNPEKTYKIFEKFKVTDGVTTALQMHGGSERCKAYYQHFSAVPHYINYGASVFVMRIRNAYNTVTERKRMVQKNLDEGALGVSHSIEYQPTPYEETLEYAKLAKKYDRPLFLHLRYSSKDKELEGVDEGIKLAKESGARVHFDHLHSTGGTFNMEEALQKISTGRKEGLPITICVYPYSYWATYLHSKRFDEGWRQRYGLNFNDLRLVGTGERLTPESFARYRKEMRLVAVPEGTMPLDKTIDLALKEDYCMIGSDGGIEYEPGANSHPRGAGCFSTAIRHALQTGISLEKIIEKMTSLPGSVVMPAMINRGVLQNGAIADLTVFNKDTIDGKASVDNPNQFSTGIEMVIVNGKVAFYEGKLMDPNGIAIKY